MTINSVNLSFYTDIIDKIFLNYYLLDSEDGEQESANISLSSTNDNKQEESGVAPNEDRSDGKRESDLVLLKNSWWHECRKHFKTPNISLSSSGTGRDSIK